MSVEAYEPFCKPKVIGKISKNLGPGGGDPTRTNPTRATRGFDPTRAQLWCEGYAIQVHHPL